MLCYNKVLEEIEAFLKSEGVRCKVNRIWRDKSPKHWLPRYHLTVYDKESVLTCIFNMHPYLIVKLLDVEWAWEVLEGIKGRKNLPDKVGWNSQTIN